MVADMLRKIPETDITAGNILNAYAKIDAWTHGTACDGMPPPPKPAISMRQNDMWIAATAHAHRAFLLTTDKDFDHPHPHWLDYAYIDQKSTASSKGTGS